MGEDVGGRIMPSKISIVQCLEPGNMSPDMGKETMKVDVEYILADGTSIPNSLIRFHLIIWVLKRGKHLRLWSQQETRLQRFKVPDFEDGGRGQEPQNMRGF